MRVDMLLGMDSKSFARAARPVVATCGRGVAGEIRRAAGAGCGAAKSGRDQGLGPLPRFSTRRLGRIGWRRLATKDSVRGNDIGSNRPIARGVRPGTQV